MTETLDETPASPSAWSSIGAGLGPRAEDLRPALVIKGRRQDPQARPRWRCALHAGGRRHHLGRSRREDEGGRRHRAYPDRKRQDPRHHRRSAARRELFEARQPKESAVIAEIPERSASAGTTRTSGGSRSSQPTRARSRGNIWFPRASTSTCRKATSSRRATSSSKAIPAPHDILAIKGVEELAGYLVNEIQEVYRLQGVAINDKQSR